jgi:YHS domain-containing protein
MKLCILLLALTCLCSWSEGQVKIRNKKCTFPFTYNGVKYYHCINADNTKLWCGLDAEYQTGRFAECQPNNCVFPFVYKGVTYQTCAKEADGSYWCSWDKEYKARYSSCEGFVEGEQQREAEPEKKEVKIFCLDSNKKKHEVGDEWTDKCTKFECTKDGGKIIQSKCQGKTGCHNVGAKNYACEHEGETFETCSCVSKGSKVFNVIELERDVNPKLKKAQVEEEVEEPPKPKKPTGCVILDMVRIIGSTWTSNCVTYRCNEDGQISVVQSKCQGKNGCFDLGQSGYPCMENGKLYKVCTCSGRGKEAKNLIDTSSLYNEEDEIVCKSDDGKQYKVGKRWTSKCAQYICEKGGQASLLSAKCEDRQGNCMDIGATQYKCDYKGKRYDECVCKGDAKSPFSEGVTPEGAKDVKITQVKMCFDTQGNLATRWKDGCTEFACVNGESKVVTQRCRDDADKCFDLHSKDFPCTMDNKIWKKCSCDASPDGPSLNAAMG